MDSKQDLKKYVKELRARARLERKLKKLRELQEQAQANANRLPEPQARVKKAMKR